MSLSVLRLVRSSCYSVLITCTHYFQDTKIRRHMLQRTLTRAQRSRSTYITDQIAGLGWHIPELCHIDVNV